MKKRKKVLFACPSHEILAKDLSIMNPEIILGRIDWGKFDDGFPNLKVLNVLELNDADVIFLADFYNAEEIFRQLAVLYSLAAHSINSLKVFLPFFSTGTMDRIMEEGQVVTAKTLARMLSIIPPAAHPAQIIIFDIHALQEQFYFSDQVRVRHISAISLLLHQLRLEGKTKDSFAVAFPDEGAYKRFGQYFKEYDQIVCEKRRQIGGGRFITIKEGTVKGKEILIVDDIILSGNTLLECAKLLVKEGATFISTYATHGVFPKKNWNSFFDSGIDLYLSDSCPKTVNDITTHVAYSPAPGTFKLISLAPIIMKEINSI
ncbi:MAG: phosphoribosyltransferase family protein [Candidatus Falkowbacteria bacterium]